MALFVKKCPCLRPKIEEDVRTLDYRHCSLNAVPGEVFNFERTLEELLVDSNQIEDLPRELFYCHGLRKLSLSDNEIKQIPAAIGHLISLENIDLSKNGVIDIPENIKSCKYLQVVDASVNPLGKLPDGFTQLLNLTQLYLNDTFLDYLPGNFGRLSKLKILEIRENHLKTLPKSFSRLVELEKLDIGHNEFTELPDVIGSLSSLLELWCDHNQVASITPTIGNLKQLMFFDGCNNCLQSLPIEIEGCVSLADLHLTTNQIQSLPDTICNLENLTTLKVDDNCLSRLPQDMGRLQSLSELNVSANMLTDLPSSLGLLRYLRTLYADDNDLTFIPAEVGSCSGITVLSLRSNKLTYIPDEIGRIPRLRVLNISSNRLTYLPFTFVKLKELQALWLSENQTRPLIPLQSEHDESGRKILTCYLLPQSPPQDSGDQGGDTDSFHMSMWDEERRNRQQIHFEFGDDSDVDGSLIRQPTPYPKEMREKARHLKNMALRQQLRHSGRPPPHGEDNPAYDEEKHVRGRLQDSREDVRTPKKHTSRDNSPAASDRSSRKGKDRKSRTSGMENADDGGFNEPRVSSLGSTPDIPSAMKSPSGSGGKFTYCTPGELNRKLATRSETGRQGGSYRSHPRSQRHRRMRDYDSDTGYRSDQELLKFRQKQQEMFSQRNSDNYSEIIPIATPSKGRRRDGYSSDVEGYSWQAVNAAYHGNGNSDNSNHVYNTSGSTNQLLDSTFSGNYNNRSPSKQSISVRNDELYEHNPMVAPAASHYPPSPSPLHKTNVVDQSTPVTPSTGRAIGRRERRQSNPDWNNEDVFHLSKQMADTSVVDPENRYMSSPPMTNQTPNGPSSDHARPVPPYKPAPPYHSSPIQRKLPPTPSRSSPYGASQYDTRSRSSPVKDYQRRMPDIQEDKRSDISRRSRTQLSFAPPGNNGEPASQDYDRPSESSRNNYMDIQINDSPRTPTSHSADVSTRSFQGHLQGDVTSASSKDSGNSSYYDHTISESPVNVRNSPLTGVRHSPLTGMQDGRVSRNSGFDYNSDPRRTFDRYDHSYREPPTVDIPARYEDIAMYKGSEPPSQVSSSTDSGYGHNLFERMLETSRLGNSKGSPSPDQFNSSSNGTSCSNHDMAGQYSRGTTPVNTNDSQDSSDHERRMERFRVTITKSPGLGFSIAGGKGAYGNPFRPNDLGIFVTKVQQGGPASQCLRPGDKLLEVNGIDFRDIEHKQAVNVLKTTGGVVQLCCERDITPR